MIYLSSPLTEQFVQLPPELGLLPLQFLGVSGNLFRVPQRKVYEDGGSTSNLLKWLKDRL